MMVETAQAWPHNPFQNLFTSELLEDPKLYSSLFSAHIIVGEAVQVFSPINAVLLGPQGSGKSMILNLIRYMVMAEYIALHGSPPDPIKEMPPYLGISINLGRADFQKFGRRTVSRSLGKPSEPALDMSCAADFLNHFLFKEFLHSLAFLQTDKGVPLRKWLGIGAGEGVMVEAVRQIASWDEWSGFYACCDSLGALISRAAARLQVYEKFLNTSQDRIPEEVQQSKTTIGKPFHLMGNLLRSLGSADQAPSLFVVIDQYEVLPELNTVYGTDLQRLVNTLIKARDPVVFYKVGARTYDWGRETRIWGAESRVELQRDYYSINLNDVLMRHENTSRWLFPRFAKDVATRRLMQKKQGKVRCRAVEDIFGPWSADSEARRYMGDRKRYRQLLKSLSRPLADAVLEACGADASPLDVRLAGAWALEQCQRHKPANIIRAQLSKRPWITKRWWRKERVEIALHQVASVANSMKLYYGWGTVIALAGGNITAFLMLFGEVWDEGEKRGAAPEEARPLSEYIQTYGILTTSRKWRERDRTEMSGGSRRYEVLSRLGPAIHDAVVHDWALSNPGHTGFSLRESELIGTEHGDAVGEFLQNGVSWGILEDRPHTSKLRESHSRRKWYLHPLLSPAFGIPHNRVKEPRYVSVDVVYQWLFAREDIDLRAPGGRGHKCDEPRLPFEEAK